MPSSDCSTITSPIATMTPESGLLCGAKRMSPRSTPRPSAAPAMSPAASPAQYEPVRPVTANAA